MRIIEPVRQRMRKKSVKIETGKLLMGGEGWIPANRYASATGNLLRPSTLITEGPHFKLLSEYVKLQTDAIEEGWFYTTDYYKNAAECIELTGSYFGANCKEDIIEIAKRFARSFSSGVREKWGDGKLHSHDCTPLQLHRIYGSELFQIVDGQHRAAGFTFSGEKSCSALLFPGAVKSPAQELVLNVLWQGGRDELYQPIGLPEMKSWRLVRKCTDRLTLMKEFVSKFDNRQSLHSYLDLGASYGWFVSKMKADGFASVGVERDPAAIRVGEVIYGLNSENSICSSLETFLSANEDSYDIVSLFSVLHHFVLGRSCMSADELISSVDKITKSILFLDTGQSHEEWFRDSLSDWTPDFIEDWILKRTSFTRVIRLGVDEDSTGEFSGNYKRTLFACVR